MFLEPGDYTQYGIRKPLAICNKHSIYNWYIKIGKNLKRLCVTKG